MNITIDSTTTFNGFGWKGDVIHKNIVRKLQKAAKNRGLTGDAAKKYVNSEYNKLKRINGHSLFD